MRDDVDVWRRKDMGLGSPNWLLADKIADGFHVRFISNRNWGRPVKGWGS